MFSLSQDTIYWVIFAVPSILIASTVHEYSHGLAAYKLGDPTAKAEGRLTLNPLPHIDPIGALCMVLFRFGWSKPVPINEYNFSNRVVGTALTALAGPVSNFILAILAGILNQVLNLQTDSFLNTFLFVFVLINLSLGIFNLIPIPPLDGHKIVRALLPKKIRYYWDELEKFSIFFLILILLPFSPVSALLMNTMSSILTRTLSLFGFL